MVNPMEDLETRRLVIDIGQGSESALRALYDSHSSSIYRFALSRLSDSAEAADVVNDVFYEVWRSAAKRFRGDSKVSTWLLSIANHKVMDRLRRRGREPARVDGEAVDTALDRMVAENISDEPPGESAVAAAQDADRIRHCLKMLSPALRQAVYLAFFEDRSYGEIAIILECPEGTVKTRIFHARRRLRECLDAMGQGQE